MALTEGDKAECKEIARSIVAEVLKEHIRSCPHGIKIITSRAYLVGICIGGALTGGSIGGAVSAMVFKIMQGG